MKLLDAKTTLREAYNYGQYFLRQPDLPKKKFIIFGWGRSGSILLVSLLDSHNKIHCDGEILHNPVLSPHLQIKLCASRCHKPIYGFKLLTYQIKQVQQIKKPCKFVRQLHYKRSRNVNGMIKLLKAI